MKKRERIAILLLLFCLPATASGQGSRKDLAMPGRHCVALEDLGLSASQMEAVRKIENGYKESLFELRHELMLKHIELRGLLRDPMIPESMIRKKALEIDQVQDEYRKKMIDYQIAIRAILGPDQLKRWCTLMGGPGRLGARRRWP